MALSPRDTSKRRAERTRRRLKALANGRPRLSIFRSDKNIYAQVIDDQEGKTIASANTTEGDFKGDKKTRANKDTAVKVGRLVAERSKAKNITKVVFDRGGLQYHGKVKALADAAREGGLEF